MLTKSVLVKFVPSLVSNVPLEIPSRMALAISQWLVLVKFSCLDLADNSQTSMFVPDPVVSLALKPTGQETPNFSRALNRFTKEDPTFRVHIDKDSKEVGPFIFSFKIIVLTLLQDYYLWNGRASSRNLCRANAT